MKIKYYLIIILLLLSCSHLKVVKFNNEVYSPTSQVDIYSTKSPTLEYIEIAKLSVRKKDNSIEMLVDEAKKIGADGLILLGDEFVGTGYIPTGNSVYGLHIKDVGAVAIKYIKKQNNN